MSAQCRATRANGTPCGGVPLAAGYCWAHDPQLAEQRRVVRSKGGKGSSTAARASKALPEHLRAVEQTLLRLIDDVLSGEQAARPAEVAAGIAGRLLDLARFSFELSTAQEIERRLTQLEQQAQRERRAR